MFRLERLITPVSCLHLYQFNFSARHLVFLFSAPVALFYEPGWFSVNDISLEKGQEEDQREEPALEVSLELYVF